VEDGQTGLLVPPGDAKALADSVLRLLRDDALAGRVGEAAYRRYLQRYAPEVTTRQIEACFRELARTHRRGFSEPRFSGLEQVDAKES
jgi:glycosyltransferase involved in cell wall biosynthesis